MAKEKADAKSHPKITKEELRLYLKNELPAKRHEEIKSIVQSSFFYTTVLEGIKAEDSNCASAEPEAKSFIRLKEQYLRLFKMASEYFKKRSGASNRFPKLRIALP